MGVGYMKKRVLTESLTIQQYIIVAFQELLSELPFEKITVQLIAKRAGVNRSTFYLHFKDKNDLLDEITEQLLLEFVSYYQVKSIEVDEEIGTAIARVPLQICEHIHQNSDFYKGRIRDRAFITRLYELLYETLQVTFKNEALSSFTAFGTIGYLTKWIEEDCQMSVKETAGGLTSIGEMAYRVNGV